MKASARGAIGALAVVVVALLAFSGGSAENPRTPPALPGLPPPFLTAAVLGDGGLTAGLDAYGNVVDLRAPGPAGPALIDNTYERQLAGTVPAETGIVPLASLPGGAAPFWDADSVDQRYRPGTNVLRTVARFGDSSVAIECAAHGGELGCTTAGGGHKPRARLGGLEVSFGRHLLGGDRRVHLDDEEAARIIARATRSDRSWLARARPLGPEAPAWAVSMYERSLLVLRASSDPRTGAVAAGARDGWAYVWPRDAGAVAIALAAAGYRGEARRIGGFLLDLDLGAAARFEGDGDPVPGREAQGDAGGWVAVAAEAGGLAPPTARPTWRDRADYQERSPANYLGNALSALHADGPISPLRLDLSARRRLVRVVGEPESGVDSAAAWAVLPFPRPALRGAALRSIRALLAGSGRFGIVPSEDWGERDPWTAPTAWSAWSLAALGRRAEALRLVADLRRAATPAGLLPERVDFATGTPRSTTPLAWSHAFTALALRSLWPGQT
ncbi:MAG TPA: hypothetical protein VIT85_00450 [Solirubrobacterales bacterium]